MMCKGDNVNTIYERLLVDDTTTKQIAQAGIGEIGNMCGSSRKGRLRGRILRVYNQQII